MASAPMVFKPLSRRVLKLVVGEPPKGLRSPVLMAEPRGYPDTWRVEAGSEGYTVGWGGKRLTTLLHPSVEENYIVIRHTLEGNDRVYGFGEKYLLSLDRRYKRFHLWNAPQSCHLPSGDPMYISVPFYMVARPGKFYGVFVDHAGYIGVDTGVESLDAVTLRIRGGGAVVYIIAGDTPSEILDTYTEMTGRPYMPPKWALGYHQCRYSYMSQAEVLEVAEKFRELGIPCDAIYLDIDYMDGYRIFTWSRERFPDPEELARRLHALGMRMVTIIDVGVKAEKGYRVYDEGMRIDAFLRSSSGELFRGGVWPGTCVFPDFLRSSVRGFWANLVAEHLSRGVDGVWLDMNEPEIFYMEDRLEEAVRNLYEHLSRGEVDEAGMKFYFDTMPRVWTGGFKHRGYTEIDAYHVDDEGRRVSHMDLHNAYPLLECEATLEGFLRRDPGKRWFILTRAGFAGIQRCAATWTGDNDSDWGHMAASIPMLLNLGLSGIPFAGADVGGFKDDVDPEMLVRWIQLGAFYPFFRNHSAKGTRRQEPWVFGEPYTSIIAEAIRLRYRFLPYIYTLFAESHRNGKPMMRPLFLEFPEDEESYDVSDQFLIGDSLLVAPIITPGARARAVYLPRVRWTDYWSHRVLGPGWSWIEAPLDRIPLLLREDGAVLTTDPVESTAVKPSLLRIEAFLARRTRLYFYDDDGETLGYREGKYFEAEVVLERRDNRVFLEFNVTSMGYLPSYKELEVRILNGEGLEFLEFQGGEAEFSVREGVAVARLRFDELASPGS